MIGIILFASGSWAAVASQVGASQAQAAPAADLTDIQKRIQQARLASVTSGDPAALAAIAADLRAAAPARTGQRAYYLPYWLAYAEYLHANALLRAGHKAEAAAVLREAYDRLAGIPSPDAESHALLSLVAGSRIVAASPEQMGEAIGQARDALERAIEAGPANIRVLYARALADYTTPKEYGGSRAAEKFLRTALDQPPEPPRALRPSWGRDDCAALLVRVLRAGDRESEAATLLSRSLAEYPESAPLRAMAK
ncbi:hypothetical protein RZN05_03575 [Sphingomonas sp. HF-S4]|uniref:Tetratricopeptide repeat protein n=1 Tax=Sphingomonas agrestis TaxID=3080540 RepID=A0ABU3Y3S6_9SPHN|nr:hypothetical protein [Sphingomonas sp. HF-S4]MDV3456049.1 hypothetical protein [Sphingomonas sp. HF-S4]